jgi:hypothetical protein
MVAAALPNGRWMRGLRRLEPEVGLRQFVDLWAQLSQVQLSSMDDTIAWRFTANGSYSAQSAYNVQFTGTVRDGPWNTIWKAKVENKCHFFTWLLLQNKLPTSDCLLKHGRQANPVCTLCRTHAETHLHMTAKCSYTTLVWQQIATLLNIQVPSLTADQ